jgi:hypothetical protein
VHVSCAGEQLLLLLPLLESSLTTHVRDAEWQLMAAQHCRSGERVAP